MLLLTKLESAIISFILIIPLAFTGSLYAQTGSYAGNEANIESGSLMSKANMTDFGDEICAKIFEDDKNTYYAVDVSKLASKYEQIRILELTYANKVIVNTSNDSTKNYYLFLVNNTLNKSEQDIITLFDGFSVQAKTELETMNNEQLRLWLIQHDKYSGK
jgi:hypothetical protein